MSLILLLIAFGGGVFGSLFGGTIAFIFSGILTLTGLTITATTGNSFFVDQIAFGPFFGPQVSFVGGVAAAAWMSRISTDRSVGSDVKSPLFSTKSISAHFLGGVFGTLGFIFNFYLSKLILPIDSVALTVVIFGILARLLIAKDSLHSNLPTNIKWYNDIRENWMFNVIWSFFLGCGVAYICKQIGSPAFGWSISSISLIFAYGKTKDVPVTHHITMVAGYMVLATNSIFLAGIAAVLALFLGILIQQLTNTNVNSHLDMPAAVIALLSLPIFLL